MKPAIIMPCYIATAELKELTINAIKSMRDTADVFIVAVDDGSPRDTSFLDDLADIILRNRRNGGFAKACNLGLNWAIDGEFQYIGCANNDIVVYEGWLEALIEPFEKWDDVGITGLVSSKNVAEASSFRGSTITTGGLLRHHMQSGGLWMSTLEVLEAVAIPGVGVFDEQFLIGGEEDVDLFMRMLYKHGYQLVMSDKSMFWHKEGATRWNEEISLDFPKRNKAIENKNYDKYAKKWGYDIRVVGIPFSEDVLEA